MLILTIPKGKSVQVGNATVTVTEIQGGQVKLGFDAPPDVAILREDAKEKLPQPAVSTKRRYLA